MSGSDPTAFSGPRSEEMRILYEFVEAATPAEERAIVQRYPILMDRGVIPLMGRLIELVQGKSRGDEAALLRTKRATLVRIQGGS